MKTLLALACLAACAMLAACNTASGSPGATIDPATVRATAEATFDASVVGLEATIETGALTGQAKIDARTGLIAGHAALVAGRATFAASGVATTPTLAAAIQQTDADFNRVLGELGT